MGKRSRKRGGVSPLPAATPLRSPTPQRRPRASEAPKAPWAPFPLVELCILVALILIGLGFFSAGRRGQVLLGAGVVLVCLASLELTVREHFAGFRSHSMLLAGAGAVGGGAVLYLLAGVPRSVVLVVAAAAFATLWRLLRAVFIRRSGVGFRA